MQLERELTTEAMLTSGAPAEEDSNFIVLRIIGSFDKGWRIGYGVLVPNASLSNFVIELALDDV